MIRRPPRSTRTDTLFPYTTLFRSELTAGTRVGIHRYSFPAGKQAHLLLDLRLSLYDYPGKILWSGLHLRPDGTLRSEEHTSELQSLMRISYAVFCLKKKTVRIYTIANQEVRKIHIAETQTTQ